MTHLCLFLCHLTVCTVHRPSPQLVPLVVTESIGGVRGLVSVTDDRTTSQTFPLYDHPRHRRGPGSRTGRGPPKTDPSPRATKEVGGPSVPSGPHVPRRRTVGVYPDKRRHGRKSLEVGRRYCDLGGVSSHRPGPESVVDRRDDEKLRYWRRSRIRDGSPESCGPLFLPPVLTPTGPETRPTPPVSS